MDRKEWAWAAGSAVAFVVSGIVAEATLPMVQGLVASAVLVWAWWVPAIWALLAGAAIGLLRRALFGTLGDLRLGVLVLGLGVSICAAYELAFSAWAIHRLVIFGQPVFQNSLLGVAAAGFAGLIATPAGRPIPAAAVLVTDGWALASLAPSVPGVSHFAQDSIALSWLPIVALVYVISVTALVGSPFMRGWRVRAVRSS